MYKILFCFIFLFQTSQANYEKYFQDLKKSDLLENFISKKLDTNLELHYQDYRKINQNKTLLQFSIKTREITSSNDARFFSQNICFALLQNQNINKDILVISFFKPRVAGWSEYLQYEYKNNKCD